MTKPQLSRRGFLGAGLSTLAATGLAACGGKSAAGGGGGPLKFWDMVWGTGADYTAAANKITGSYRPASGLQGVNYQSIPWANWYSTFTSAVASQTGPAISSGASFQPFYFLEQGAVLPADGVVEKLKKEQHDDFLPGLLESMKTDKGYAGVPWSLDLRVLWYRKSLLEAAGADVPTTWDEYIDTGKKLKKQDKIGFGLAAGSSTTDAQHSIFALFINNGGGLFNESGDPDCTNARNVEALDFVQELVHQGIIDPRSASYTSDNLDSDWAGSRIAMGFGQTGLNKTMKGEVADDLVVAKPIKSPNGSTGTIYYVNAIMLYENTPDQESAEAFAAWYLGKTDDFWAEGVQIDLPVTKRVAETELIQKEPSLVTSINEWQPIGKTLGARASAPFGALNSVDGGKAAASFVQQVVAGKTSSQQLLQTLQNEIEKLL